MPDRSLWFGRASLFQDRIVIRGWTWRGRYHQEIEMENIEEVDWRPTPEGPNLTLYLEDGKRRALRLHRGGGLWNAKLHDLLDKSMLNRHKSPDRHSQSDSDRERT